MRKFIFFILSITIFHACKSEPKPLNVMTFNIRFDNPDDSLNNWKYRKDIAISLIPFYDIDVLGMQEVLHNQLEDMKMKLTQYNFIGVGREDGVTKGEYSPVCYKKERFELLNQGTFWLSENPEAVGKKGWDAACERIVTWVELKDKKNDNKKLFFFNTHFDHRGEIARINSVTLLLDKVKEIAGNNSIIVTGDFNSYPNSNVYKSLTDPSNELHFIDSKQLAKDIHGQKMSFQGFGKVPEEQRNVIDYIFLKNIEKVNRYGIIGDKVDGVYLSDHNPVMATVLLK